MNREEFLAKLFGLYATTFSKGNATNWTEAYKQVLADNIDYDKLFDYMLKNYSGATAPSPAFLSKNAGLVESVVICICVAKGGATHVTTLEDLYYGNISPHER